ADRHGTQDVRSGQRRDCGSRENPAKPMWQKTSGHGHSLYTRSCSGAHDGLRNVDQILRIVLRQMSTRQYSGVARFFGKRGELTFEPPGERMKPEHRMIEQCEPLNQGIMPLCMFLFVS